MGYSQVIPKYKPQVEKLHWIIVIIVTIVH